MNFTRDSIKTQLIGKIIPFWLNQEDKDYGGFYGVVRADLSVDKQADKSAVLMTRYLWALSAAYKISDDIAILNAADNVYRFIVEKMIDQNGQGIYWSVTFDGKPKITQKHIYVQSFAIYALSEYYKISNNQESLDLAINLYQLVESKAYDVQHNGYHEEFTQDWQPSPATLMGPRGTAEYYTTNSVLHLVEAYTNLYQTYPDLSLLEDIKNLLNIFSKHIISEKGHCQTEFSRDWQAMNLDISYAHDIETAWLLFRTLEVIDETDNQPCINLIDNIVESVVADGLDTKGIIIDQFRNGQKTSVKQWWSLAESVIGFYDAYTRTEDSQYKKLAEKHWEFVQNHLINPITNSEWLPHIDETGQMVAGVSSNISDAWKGPYHTVRMYVEMLDRLP